MSISNLTTSGIKTFQDLNINNIICQDLTIEDGMLLPTIGGISSVLDFYESYSFNTTFTCRSGSPSSDILIKLVRIGNIVNITIPLFSLTSGSGSPSTTIQTNDGVIPERFRPNSGSGAIFVNNARVNDNGTAFNGMIFVQGTGRIEIYKNVSLNTYTSTATVGLFNIVSGSYNFI